MEESEAREAARGQITCSLASESTEFTLDLPLPRNAFPGKGRDRASLHRAGGVSQSKGQRQP